MERSLRKAAAAVMVLLTTATPALSHWDPAVHGDGYNHAPDFLEGFLHVLSGLDHIALALVIGVALSCALPARSWRLVLLVALAAGASVGFAHIMAVAVAAGSAAFIAGIAAATVLVAALGGFVVRLARRKRAR